jgi:thiosulfate/3-mercaptopyruvate sulfurtransferase
MTTPTPRARIRPPRFVVVALALLAIAAGCSSPTRPSTTATSAVSTPSAATTTVVPAAAAAHLIATSHPVVLAASTTKQTGTVGFIGGAVSVDVDEWTADSLSQAQLDDLPMWSSLIGGLGISSESTVVVYDDGELKFGSRIRYLLAHFGVGRALLVEGGWPALDTLAAQGKLTTQPAATAPVPAEFTAHVVEEPVPMVWADTVAASIHKPSTVLLDVRAAAEFDGTVLLPPVTRGGHIPGAVNGSSSQLFASGTSGDLASPATIRQRFESDGVVPGRTIIVYCQDGARSSLVASVLRQIGYPSVELYYLSYADWQADPQRPVIR